MGQNLEIIKENILNWMDIKASLHQKTPLRIESWNWRIENFLLPFHGNRKTKNKKPSKPIMVKAYISRTHKER